MDRYLPYIIPTLLTALLNALFYILIKRSLDNSIKRYEISYSGVFKEKVEVYKNLLHRIHDLKLRISQFQFTESDEIKNSLRQEFNDLIRSYLVNRPFLSEQIISLFQNITKELQSVYEAIVLGSISNYGKLTDKELQRREKIYWEAVNKLRSNDFLNQIEIDIITEIRKDLQTLK